MGMLVLSRKLDEEIIINGNIRIHVIEIRGDKVRLGVDAPRDMTVHRKEIHDEILAERKLAIDSPESIARREAENLIDPDFGKDHS